MLNIKLTNKAVAGFNIKIWELYSLEGFGRKDQSDKILTRINF